MTREELVAAFEQAKRLRQFEDAYAIEQQIKAMDEAQPKDQPESRSVMSGVSAVLPEPYATAARFVEPAMTVASSAVAEPTAGIAGAYGAVTGGVDRGVDLINRTREALTYMPRTQGGVAGLNSVAETLAPVGEFVQGVERAVGDKGYEIGGPLGGAIGTVLPAATMELLGLGAARRGKSAVTTMERINRATPAREAQDVLDAGARLDVPVLTTDVKPPTTFLGRWAQTISEKLGPLGSGTARASQQAAREEAVRGLAEAMDIDLDSPFADDMVRSINRVHAKELAAAGAQRDRAVASLTQFGALPMDKTRAAIARMIAYQERLGPKADAELVKSLQDTLEAIDGGDFSLIRDIRSELIKEKKDVARGDNARRAGALQYVKSAMDKDMMDFARTNDRAAAADWIRSNRAFAEGYQRIKDTELNRILKSGTATPEKIMPLIRGGKPSELNRLYRSLDDSGRIAAQKAILQDAFKESGFFETTNKPNPDRFATALNKPNRQQAIRIFFRGDAKKELDGMARLLDATRRAQSGQAVLKTGEQNLLMLLGAATGAGAYASGGAVIPPIVVASALAKAYESAKFRNLMLRLSNTQRGSKAETGLLELAAAFVAPELRAATEEQAQEQ